jgi:hypothetical protein
MQPWSYNQILTVIMSIRHKADPNNVATLHLL